MARQDHHEQSSRSGHVQAPSERSFGYTFAAVGAIAATIIALTGGRAGTVAALAAAALLFALAAAFRPSALAPLNRIWFRFGMALHRVTAPVVMGLLFFAVISPIGIAMRLAGKFRDLRGFDRQRPSYWIDRRPPGPDPATMRNQF